MLALLILATVSGCKSRNTAPLDTGSTFSDAKSNDQFDQRIFDPATDLEIIHFDYNSYTLTPAALEVLKRNAERIKGQPKVAIQIEGHCDERGTQEYNLALGERRALTVREYLINLGVDPARLTTISLGEEIPQDDGHTEAAWSKNRRGQFNKAQ
jgi:peptidoglycan-associated lipoprotein